MTEGPSALARDAARAGRAGAVAGGLCAVEACPVCGARARRPWLAAGPITVCICEGCGHVYSESLLAPGVLAGDYYAEPDGDLAARSMRSKEARFVEYEELLRETHPRPGRVLDAGCNAGEVLTLFRARGWDPAGVEVSPGPADFARRRGLLVWTGTAEDALPGGERFDLVTLIHVLEHVVEPARLLARLRRALRPGGHLLIEVPNVADPLVRAFGRFYRPLCLGDHVSFFSARSLRALLESSGFRLVARASPTHARDVGYASLLSTVDALRSWSLSLPWPRRAGPPAGAEATPASARGPVGVQAQTRYRGALRAPLRAALDALAEGLDPAVVAAFAPFTRTERGTVLLALAEPVEAPVG